MKDTFINFCVDWRQYNSWIYTKVKWFDWFFIYTDNQITFKKDFNNKDKTKKVNESKNEDVILALKINKEKNEVDFCYSEDFEKLNNEKVFLYNKKYLYYIDLDKNKDTIWSFKWVEQSRWIEFYNIKGIDYSKVKYTKWIISFRKAIVKSDYYYTAQNLVGNMIIHNEKWYIKKIVSVFEENKSIYYVLTWYDEWKNKSEVISKYEFDALLLLNKWILLNIHHTRIYEEIQKWNCQHSFHSMFNSTLLALSIIAEWNYWNEELSKSLENVKQEVKKIETYLNKNRKEENDELPF